MKTAHSTPQRLRIALIILTLCSAHRVTLAGAGPKADWAPRQAVDDLTLEPARTDSEGSLSAATTAKAEEICPDLLALRQGVDGLYAEYLELALTVGCNESRQAQRRLPATTRALEKSLARLADAYERVAKPMDKQRERLVETEKRISRRAERRGQLGKRAVDDQRDADAVNVEQDALEVKLAVIVEVGHPGIRIENPDDLLLRAVIKPDANQQGGLMAWARNHPDLIKGRLYLAHVDADIAALAHTEDGEVAESREASAAAKLQRQRQSVVRKYRKLFLDTRQDAMKTLAELEKEKDKLLPRAERDRERGRSGRNEKRLGFVSSRLDAAARELVILDLFVRDTDVVTVAELEAMSGDE